MIPFGMIWCWLINCCFISSWEYTPLHPVLCSVDIVIQYACVNMHFVLQATLTYQKLRCVQAGQ